MDNKIRVLIINGDPIGSKSGLGITLKTLFSDWPESHICQIIFNPDCEGENDFFIHHFNLLYAPLDSWARPILNRILNRGVTQDTQATINTPAVRYKGLKAILHDVIRGFFDMSPVYVDRETWTIINDFNPDVIYTMMGSIRIMRYARKVAKCRGIQVVPHFMDNWPDTIYTTSIFSWLARQICLGNIRKLLNLSKVGLAISPMMAELYQQKYNLPFKYIGNGTEKVSKPVIKKQKVGIVFIYCGGMHLERWKSLIDIGKVLEDIKGAELRLFVPGNDWITFEGQLSVLKSVRFMGEISPNQVISHLEDGDVLIHIESFEPNIYNYIKYSLSTKIPQYLSMGKPILCYTPTGIASSHFITSAKAGLWATDIEGLNRTISQLVLDPHLRENLGINAFQVAKEISAEVMRRRLNECLEISISN